MLATVWLLLCVVCVSCEPGYGLWGPPRLDRYARRGSSSMETSMCLRIRGRQDREYEISEYSEYEFEEGEHISLRCSAAAPSHDWMLLWTDEPGGLGYSEAPSSTELRLKLTASAGDDGALLRCSAAPSGGYNLRHNHHIELKLTAKSTGSAQRSSRTIFLRQGEPWEMDCDSGWIKQRQSKCREKNVYKRGDTIFQHFNKKANGTILYCNLYRCRTNPSSQELALSMKEVLECTRTQQQYIFLLNEDSREDTNNKPVHFPNNRKDSDELSENKQQNTHTPYRTISASYSGSAGSTGNKWNMRDYVPGAEHPIIAEASVGSPGVDPEPKQTEETKQGTNVAVVVGSLLGVVVLALLVALVLLLRHLAAHRNQAPSEPYVVYTELAEGRGGAPPPPPRNLTPYAVVVGTLVPAPKHAPRPISHTYCTVK